MLFDWAHAHSILYGPTQDEGAYVLGKYGAKELQWSIPTLFLLFAQNFMMVLGYTFKDNLQTHMDLLLQALEFLSTTCSLYMC